jgi:hypothetical protein
MGAAGVDVGGQGEVEVEGEEELELERVELRERDAADVCPASGRVSERSGGGASASELCRKQWGLRAFARATVLICVDETFK